MQLTKANMKQKTNNVLICQAINIMEIFTVWHAYLLIYRMIYQQSNKSTDNQNQSSNLYSKERHKKRYTKVWKKIPNWGGWDRKKNKNARFCLWEVLKRRVGGSRFFKNV